MVMKIKNSKRGIEILEYNIVGAPMAWVGLL
jgi:hypothetical protein